MGARARKRKKERDGRWNNRLSSLSVAHTFFFPSFLSLLLSNSPFQL